MSHRFRHAMDCQRRGAALLLVLATLALVVSASVALLQVAATSHLAQQTIDRSQVAAELREAAEGNGGPIQHWLSHDAVDVVLPPDAESPRMTVLSDRWLDSSSGEVIGLTITAFDQHGMMPWRALRDGSTLRMALPTNVLATLEQVQPVMYAAEAPIGLDQFSTKKPESMSLYPLPQSAPPRWFGDGARSPPELKAAGNTEPALGEFISTHPVDPDARILINANTAPMPLVEAALRAVGRSGIDLIKAARAAGRSASVPEIGGRRLEPGVAHQPIRLTGSSTCWAFRIDCHAGPLRRSWWAVYAPSRTPGSSNPWECLQRLAITE